MRPSGRGGGRSSADQGAIAAPAACGRVQRPQRDRATALVRRRWHTKPIAGPVRSDRRMAPRLVSPGRPQSRTGRQPARRSLSPGGAVPATPHAGSLRHRPRRWGREVGGCLVETVQALLQADCTLDQIGQAVRERRWDRQLRQVPHLEVQSWVDHVQQPLGRRRVQHREQAERLVLAFGEEGRPCHVEDASRLEPAALNRPLVR